MINYIYIVVISIIMAGGIGYQAASNDLLQQVLTSRKISQCLAELICAVLVVALLWIKCPAEELRLLPLAPVFGYGITLLLLHFRRKKKTGEVRKEIRSEYRETLLRTAISVLTATAVTLLLCQIMARNPWPGNWPDIPENDLYLCDGILLVVTVLLSLVLAHYLVVIWMDPSENDTPSRSLLQLRKALRSQPPI